MQQSKRESDVRTTESDAGGESLDFIRQIVTDDVARGAKVATRFPPEPNGYLHIGHAKSIVLNFGIAEEFGGTCNLRFDDTNPTTEEVEYVDSIKEDVRWLGYDWGEREYFASDYFDKLHELAVQMIRDGKAYVCELSKEEAAEFKGDYYRPGRESPYRARSVEENLALFERMRRGELDEGAAVLRAKIDMQAPNMNLRDPPMVRVIKRPHHRTGDTWCIYPTYDWTHGQSDAFEGITHSLCTLEFEDHRPLYDWFLDQLALPARPRQIEFARLNVSYTVLSKRRLITLVREGHVDGWDDPRMPTLCGLRRRGYPPEAIRKFCERVGIAKSEGVVDVALLEHAVREHLNETAPRVMAVLDPLKVVITNYPEGEEEEFEAPYHPQDPSYGSRKVPFSRELYIERDDFREVAPRKWHRLSPGAEVRLRYACLIRCVDVIKGDDGEIKELHCTWDPESRGGKSPDGRRVRGTSHWVSANHAVPATVRLYDRLFNTPNPTAGGADLTASLNPDSLEVRQGMMEPSLRSAAPGSRWQFERLGYFTVDSANSRPDKPVFNRTVTLRDSWARIERRNS